MKNSLIDRRKNQLLNAAEAVFAREGFASASTDIIAKKANVGKGTIYRYFKDKKALFFAVVDRGLEKLRFSMFTETSKVSDPIDKIETAVKTYLSFFQKNPSLADVFIHEHSSFHNRIEKRYFEHYYGIIERIKQTFKTAIEKSTMKNIDIDSAVSMLASTLQGFVYKWHIDGKRYNLSEKAPVICGIFFAGVLKDKQRRKNYE